jgi:hypothetical protein
MNDFNYSDYQTEVKKIINTLAVEDERFNYMIVSMHVFNALCTSHIFYSYFGNDEVAGITEVGSFRGYKVFLDMYMKPGEIILSCDRVSMRDYRLDQILDGNIFIKEKRVKIS